MYVFWNKTNNWYIKSVLINGQEYFDISFTGDKYHAAKFNNGSFLERAISSFLWLKSNDNYELIKVR